MLETKKNHRKWLLPFIQRLVNKISLHCGLWVNICRPTLGRQTTPRTLQDTLNWIVGNAWPKPHLNDIKYFICNMIRKLPPAINRFVSLQRLFGCNAPHPKPQEAFSDRRFSALHITPPHQHNYYYYCSVTSVRTAEPGLEKAEPHLL